MQRDKSEAIALQVAFGFIVAISLFMAGVSLFYHVEMQNESSAQDVENCIEGTIPADLNTGLPIRERCIIISREQIDEAKCREAQREVNQEETAVADLNARLIELSVVIKTEYQTSAEHELKEAQREAEKLCYFLTPTIEPTLEIISPTISTSKSENLTSDGATPTPTVEIIPTATATLQSTSTFTPTMKISPSMLPKSTQIQETVAPTMVVVSPTPLKIPVIVVPITATPMRESTMPSSVSKTSSPVALPMTPEGPSLNESGQRLLSGVGIWIAIIATISVNLALITGVVLKFTGLLKKEKK